MNLHTFGFVFTDFIKEELLYGVTGFLQSWDIGIDVAFDSFLQTNDIET